MLQHNLEIVEREGTKLSLNLNHCNSEVLHAAPGGRNSIVSSGGQVVDL